MRWRFLDRIRELEPGRHAVADASTDLPEELFADHFPTFPVTPGVLLVEMAAQLSGLLLQATVWEEQRRWVFPVLGILEKAKFRAFVPPRVAVEIRSEIASLRPEAAICKARVLAQDRCCATMELLLFFDVDAGPRKSSALEAHSRAELARLQAPWSPT